MTKGKQWAKAHERTDVRSGLVILRRRGFTTKAECVRSVVVIEIASAAALVSPAYDDGATEETISARWLDQITERHGTPNEH